MTQEEIEARIMHLEAQIYELKLRIDAQSALPPVLSEQERNEWDEMLGKETGLLQ